MGAWSPSAAGSSQPGCTNRCRPARRDATKAGKARAHKLVVASKVRGRRCHTREVQSRTSTSAEIQVARIAGIPIRIGASVLLIIGIICFSLASQFLGGSDSAVSVIAFTTFGALAFIGSILAHEFGHAMAARRHGIGTIEINLWLLGGVAKLDRQAPTPAAEFQIAVAGPVVNMALAALFTLASWQFSDQRVLAAVLAWLAISNGVIGAFNLFPAAPLDGGQVLTAAIWSLTGEPDRARVWSGRVGMIVGGALTAFSLYRVVVSGDLSWLFNGAVGWFIFGAARRQVHGAAQLAHLRSTPVAALELEPVIDVPGSSLVGDTARWAGSRGIDAVRVVNDAGTVAGIALPRTAASHLGPSASWVTMSDITIGPDVVVRRWSNDRADSLFDENGATYPVAVVHDPQSGAEVGLLSGSRIGAAIPQPDLWGRVEPRTALNGRSSTSGPPTARPA